MSEAISALDLGIPERVARASAQADGTATPETRQVVLLDYPGAGATELKRHDGDN